MKFFILLLVLSLGFVYAQTTPFTSGADTPTIASFTNGQTIDAGGGADSLTVTTFNSNVGTITISNLETLTISPTGSAQGTFVLTGSGGITLNQTLASSQGNILTYNFSTTSTSDILNLSGSYTQVLGVHGGGRRLGIFTGLDTLNITGDINVRVGGATPHQYAERWVRKGYALFRAVDNVARTINISSDITLRGIASVTGNYKGGVIVGFQLTREFTNLGTATDGANTIVITGSVNALVEGSGHVDDRLFGHSVGFALGDQADTVTFRNSNSTVDFGELVRFGGGSDTLVLDSTTGSSSLTGALRTTNQHITFINGGIYDLGSNHGANSEFGVFNNPFTGLETLRKTGAGTYLLGFSVTLGEVFSRSGTHPNVSFSSTVTVAGTNVNIEAGTLIVAGDDGSDTTEAGFSSDGASADAAAVLRAGSFTISDGASLQLGQIETIGSWQVTRSGSVTGAVTINSGGRLDVEAGGSVTGTVTINSGGILDIGTRRSLSGATAIANNGGANGVSFASGGGGILEIAYASGGTVFSDAAVLDGSETLTINITGMTAGSHITLIGTGVTTGTGSNYTLQVDGSSNSGFAIDTTTTAGAIIIRLNRVSVSGITIAGSATRTVEVGDSAQRLVATVTPSDATNKAVTWASSNRSVVNVFINGVVFFVGAGTATITVTTTDGNYQASVVYRVNPVISTLGGNAIASNSYSVAGTTAQALVVNRTLNLTGTAVLKATSVAFSGTDKITGAPGATIEISGAITTASSVNTIDVENIKLQTGSSGTLYAGASANTITVSGGGGGGSQCGRWQ